MPNLSLHTYAIITYYLEFRKKSITPFNSFKTPVFFCQNQQFVILFSALYFFPAIFDLPLEKQDWNLQSIFYSARLFELLNLFEYFKCLSNYLIFRAKIKRMISSAFQTIWIFLPKIFQVMRSFANYTIWIRTFQFSIWLQHLLLGELIRSLK